MVEETEVDTLIYCLSLSLSY